MTHFVICMIAILPCAAPVLALAVPTGYKELAKMQVLSGTCWTTPVLSGGRIYCRNRGVNLVCLDVRAK